MPTDPIQHASEAPVSAGHFRQILEVSRMLAVTTELDALLVRIAEAACALLECERTSIFVHDAKTDELVTRVALQSALEIRVPSSAGIVGSAFKSNRVLHVGKPYEDPRFNPEVDKRTGFVTRNLLTAPMVDAQRQPLGVIQAVNNRSWVGFTESHELMIQLLADQAGVALQRYRLQQAAVEAMYLRREMELAREVQQGMLPKQGVRFPGFKAVGWSKAASVTGGDCYDLWTTNDGRLGIFVGDASGHGVGPALIVSQVRTLVRALCDHLSDPHDLFDCVNARLADDLNPGSFVTAFLGFLSPDGELRWTSAGHGPFFIRRSSDALLHKLTPPAAPLGIVKSYVGKRPRPVQLRGGATLAILSDGVFEARAPDGELLETDRVRDFFDRHRDQDAPIQLDALRADLTAWQKGAEPMDDQTVIIVTRDA